MTDRFESILDESISAMQAGVPIEEILAEAPDYAAELRPLLYAATLLTDPDPEPLPEERKAALRAEYMAQAAELKPAPASFSYKLAALLQALQKRMTRRAVISDLITVTLTILLTLLMSGLILSYAAGDSLPGDLLYGVKRFSENVQLLLTFSQEDQAQLQRQFNQERLAEIEQLVQQNRAAVVEFRGTVETRGENLWIIEGLPVSLPPDAVISGAPEEGDRVEVVGILRTNNVLVADTIRQQE